MFFEAPSNLFFVLADLLQLMVLLILASVIVSWAILFRAVSPYKPWVRTLSRLTDPILEPFRRLAPPRKLGGLDISPLIAIFVIQILENVLWNLGRR